ncbi:hypothetical protein M3Y99_01708000 [Aphelenchoides fujianensis]|nr:hypothetical protein M3Y99_01708000 [Aphelenchoides fujianensis]
MRVVFFFLLLLGVVEAIRAGSEPPTCADGIIAYLSCSSHDDCAAYALECAPVSATEKFCCAKQPAGQPKQPKKRSGHRRGRPFGAFGQHAIFDQ